MLPLPPIVSSGTSWLVHRNERREIRRDVSLTCRVVRERDFRLIGTRGLDLSPSGVLVLLDREAEPGEPVVMSFRTTELGLWFDAEGEIARVVHGRRPRDPGRCIGIRFTKLDPVSRLVLRGHLRRVAPPLPKRQIDDARIDYAATVRRVAFGRA
jgi:hypothetical protein